MPLLFKTGVTSYIAGIQFTCKDGLDIHLGYKAPVNQVFADITGFKGLIVSVGCKGIHALQVVMDDDSSSPWLGCPEDGAKTRHLVGGFISALKVCFGVSHSR